MDTKDYEAAAMRTAKDMGSTKMNLIHAALGMSSDAGEFTDAVKKHAIYGKPMDLENLVEEIGDVLWFCALACNSLGVTMEQVMHENIVKLAKRYPDRYSDVYASMRLDKVNQTQAEGEGAGNGSSN
jgi:NTP pyrophosphatase (non-canonical NTP hydrolase)